ncbi:uncharacterized protein METZ01_LOCUS272222, partial [marine metagenome]
MRQNVGLGQHGCTGLNKYALTGEAGALLSNIYILYPAACRRE